MSAPIARHRPTTPGDTGQQHQVWILDVRDTQGHIVITEVYSSLKIARARLERMIRDHQAGELDWHMRTNPRGQIVGISQSVDTGEHYEITRHIVDPVE